MAICDFQGTTIHYDLTPPRPNPTVIVFIHGWLLSRHYWQPLIDALSPDYQCLAIDLRGFGESNTPPTPTDRGYAPVDYAADIADLCTQLQLSQLCLVGHSLGGTVALWGAKCFPETVRQVVCVNAGGGVYLEKEFARFRSAGQQILKFRPSWFSQLPPLTWLFARANVPSPLDRRWGQQRIRDFVSAEANAALRSLLDSTTEAEVLALPPLVSQLQQPVYFVAGRQDDIMPPQYVEHLANHHPLSQGKSANVLTLDNCGHFAMLEQTPAVADYIRKILTHAE